MMEYEVTFEIKGRCKRTFRAWNFDDLWEQIDIAMSDMDASDIESIEDIDAVYIN